MKKFNFSYISLALLLILYLLIISADFLTPLKPIFGKIGAISWLISFIPLIILTVKNFLLLFQKSKKYKSYFTLFTLSILFLLLLINLSQPQNLSEETTQQTACALNHLKYSIDFGYKKICFLGYPAKQFYLTSIPTILLGRTQTALNLGGSIYFLLGIILFSYGFLSKTSNFKKADIINSIMLISLIHIYNVNYSLFHNFEQSSFPICISLIYIGLFLQYLSDSKVSLIIFMALTIQYLIFSYTPSVSFVILAIISMIHLYIIKKGPVLKLLLITILVISTITFIHSFSYRTDMRILGAANNSIEVFKNDLASAVKNLFITTEQHSYSSKIMIYILTISFLIGLFFINWQASFLCLWIAGTFIIATISEGYSFYYLQQRVDRSIIIIPLLLLIFSFIIKRINISKISLIILYLILLVTGLKFHYNVLTVFQVNQHLLLIKALQPMIILSKSHNNLYFTQDVIHPYLSINDATQYFYPSLHIKKYDNSVNTEKCSLNDSGYYITSENNTCFHTYTTQYLSTKISIQNNNLYLITVN